MERSRLREAVDVLPLVAFFVAIFFAFVWGAQMLMDSLFGAIAQ